MSKRIITLACLLALAASAVLADQVVVQLTGCNTSGAGGICPIIPAGPGVIYGTVTKTLVGTDISVALVLNDGLVLIGNGLAFNSSVTLTAGQISDISPSNYGPLNTSGTVMDGFTTGKAKFQYSMPFAGGGGLSDPSASSTLSFTINGLFTTVETIDQPNGKGYEWAAEVGLPNCGHPAGCTGFIANGASVVTPTPEPGTIALFGMGLLGAGVVIRRRRK
jgi:PEP-CTERM motif